MPNSSVRVTGTASVSDKEKPPPQREHNSRSIFLQFPTKHGNSFFGPHRFFYLTDRAAAGDPTCDEAFADAWRQLAAAAEDEFSCLQDDYARTLYFDPGARNLLNWYAFDITARSSALQQVLFANCIQHGPRYGSEVFGDAASLAGQQLTAMRDRDIIYNIYEVKLTDPAWSSGSPADRPGLYARWENERRDALALLAD